MRPKQEHLNRITKAVDIVSKRLGSRFPIPPHPDCVRWIAECVKVVKVPGAEDKLYMLKKARKGSSPESRVLLGWYQWHGGNGSLWGPMGRFGQWDVSGELSDKLDTLALAMRGGNSSAADNWKRALGQ